MGETRSTQFDLRGYNHIALVCADMQKTVDFYEGVLGFPLVKTLEMPGGRGQHFFFQVTETDGVAFFWFPSAPAAVPGVAGAEWGRVDEHGVRAPGIGGVSAAGSMHHLAFDVPLEKLPEYKTKLERAGVDVTEINRHIVYTRDGRQVADRTELPPDAEVVDEFINSLYFSDPDGMVLEFAASTRPLTAADVAHAPARPEDAAALRASRQGAAAVV